MKSFYALLYRLRNSSPVRLVTLGYLWYVLAGWALLCLPFSWKTAVSPLDNLFTAASALSTTGLATVTVSESYSFFGQLVILILIQLGGIGYMTFGSFVILSSRREFDESRKDLMRTVFSIPRDFRIEHFIWSVVMFTAIIEIAGAAALYPIFLRADAPHPLWQAVFHSVSSFCTAGFGLYPNSFENFRDHLQLNLVVSALSIAGAMGFIVCVDVWRLLNEKISQVTLTTKIILAATSGLLLGGTALLFFTEPFGGDFAFGSRILSSFFQAMSALTTVGFNTVPIGGLGQPAIMMLLILMVIGASPSGTGGGLKTTTFTAVLGLVRSACRGEKDVRFWGALVPDERIRTAVASLSVYLGTLTAGTYFLTITDKLPFLPMLFECASALGTVGLSMGITGSLSALGKCVLIAMMYVGRVGPLMIGMALSVKPQLIFDDERTDLAV
jgi:trk system potassium uptake protein TrkH